MERTNKRTPRRSRREIERLTAAGVTPAVLAAAVKLLAAAARQKNDAAKQDVVELSMAYSLHRVSRQV